MSDLALTDDWMPDLAFEVALGYYTPEELQLRFGLSETRYSQVRALPAFQKIVDSHRRDIDEKGTQFKLKARKLASALLPEVAAVVADPTASHADRISAFNTLAKMAGYGKEETQNAPQGFSVNITFNDVPQRPAIDVTPADG